MTMQKSVLKYLLTAVIAVGLAVASSAYGQGLTSSSLSGVVNDNSGKPVSGATVVAFYAPTNSSKTTTTNTAGRFLIQGLRVGGPYTVSVNANGFKPASHQDISLALSQVYETDFALEAAASDVVKMDAYVTTADASNALFDASITGSGTQISQERIQSVATVARSLNEYARLDPRVVITDRTNGETSAGGQNGRYNSIQIDGVRSNDVFGLTNSGLPSQNNPISIEWIEAFSVEFSPYDGRQSGFTGASINAVTKSGTNDFHGSIYYIYTDQYMRGRNLDSASSLFNTKEPFKEKTWGAYVGGPLIKDKLFFFLGYEKFSRTELTPTQGFVPTAAAASLITATAQAYGYNPGVLTGSASQEKEDKKVIAKLDWNINSMHRLSVRFNQTDGEQPIFQDFSSTTSTSFSGHWYTNHQKYTSYVASLFSNWTPNFQTEAKFAYSDYKTQRDPATVFPQVVITGVPSVDGRTGAVFIGTERSTQINQLDVKNTNFTLNGTYLWNDHTFTVGGDFEKNKFYNAFLQDALGSYGTSSSAGGFSYAQLGGSAGFIGNPANYSFQYSPSGGSIAADWGYNNPAFFVQDSWAVTPRLTLLGALRFDYYTSDKPAYNATFSTAFGVRNDNSIDGLRAFAPRFAFNYALDSEKKTQLRGGLGVFQGRAPGVWMSNNYSANGITTAQSTQATLAAGGVTNIPFVAAQSAQYKGGTATYPINLLDNGFKLPSVLKGNIAVDQKLPWYGLIATLEFNETKTLENIWYQDLNLKPDYVLPDGRQHYTGRINSSYTNVYIAKNTKKGEARQSTIQIQKPWKNHWFASFSYTYGQSSEVSPVTSSTASSNFGGRMVLNHDDSLARSNYEVRHRFLLNLSKELQLIKNNPTTISLIYEGRSGRPYSFVFSNDANGDGANQSNDLFYVPTGPSDPKVRWANQAQSDAFFNWLSGSEELNKYRGQVVPRNSAFSKSIHQFDIRVTQQLPVWGPFKAELGLNLLNVGNLINSDWGRYSLVGFPYNYFVASGTPSTDSVTGQRYYAYAFTSKPRGQLIDNSLSRWQAQVELRLRF